MEERKLKGGLLQLCLLVMIAVAAGCSAEPEDAEKAQPRRSADRVTVTALVESQDALHQGALRAALMLADSAVQHAPRLADAHFQRGRVLSELKHFEEAEEAYREVLALDPEYRGAWFNLGNNAFRQQQYEEALAFYRKEQGAHPSPAVLVAMGRARAALGELEGAQQAYEQAIAVDSAHAEAHARLGQLYEDEGVLEVALQHSQRALELEPENADYQYVVGSQALRLGQVRQAVQHLRAAAEKQPWHQGAHYNLGRALLRLGRQAEAERYLAEADTLRLRQSEIERLQSVAQADPEDPAQWTQLGAMLRQSGRLEEAGEVLSVALYLEPQNPILRRDIALLFSELGRDKAAAAHYRALLRQHPASLEGWFNLGVIYARNGQVEGARRAWQRVLQLEPSHQQARAYLARLEEPSSQAEE